jgi:hypothetical protein
VVAPRHSLSRVREADQRPRLRWPADYLFSWRSVVALCRTGWPTSRRGRGADEGSGWISRPRHHPTEQPSRTFRFCRRASDERFQTLRLVGRRRANGFSAGGICSALRRRTTAISQASPALHQDETGDQSGQPHNKVRLQRLHRILHSFGTTGVVSPTLSDASSVGEAQARSTLASSLTAAPPTKPYATPPTSAPTIGAIQNSHSPFRSPTGVVAAATRCPVSAFREARSGHPRRGPRIRPWLRQRPSRRSGE